jgi:hypothetical protein
MIPLRLFLLKRIGTFLAAKKVGFTPHILFDGTPLWNIGQAIGVLNHFIHRPQSGVFTLSAAG